MIIVGGGEFDYDTETVSEQSDKIVSVKIKRTSDSNKPLEFENKAVHQMHQGIENLSPYVETLEDKVVIAQSGYVSDTYLISTWV